MSGDGWALVPVLGALGACGAAGFGLGLRVTRSRPRRPGGAGAGAGSGLGTPVELATFETLHAASLAAPPLRAGLTRDAARRAVRGLRGLLGTEALALADRTELLAWDGPGADHHGAQALAGVAESVASGRGRGARVVCERPGCPLRWAVWAPLTGEDGPAGALVAFGSRESAVLARAAVEVARWVSVQLELSELDRSRTRLMEAEIRALRAQISPHFIFNSLAAIASFTRTDPEHARELLLEFADFTRYSFRRRGEFATLAEELRAIEQYLALAGARFGDRLTVTLRVAPEVLPVAVPFLCLQPLVENAVKHGLEDSAGGCRIVIEARDAGTEAVFTIEDDGVGMDPARLRRILAGEERGSGSGVGLPNVDERLRQTFGDEHGLVIETGPGAGTKVTVRVPKYHPDVRA
ncbi:sensor histidine kinase [Streptomyces sp. BI20]|uniref:sensor histidine kinase n=1 Tax=Streptomyces sp. BI20 TaxID=3403460 RepID=UPI003C71A27A